MKQTLAIVAGAVAGVLLAGALAPSLLWILPSRLRGATALWSTMAIFVVLTASACGLLWSWSHRE